MIFLLKNGGMGFFENKRSGMKKIEFCGEDRSPTESSVFITAVIDGWSEHCGNRKVIDPSVSEIRFSRRTMVV